MCYGGFSNGHAIAQALGGVYHEHKLVHGHCCAITLPAAVRWHANTSAGQIRKLADSFGVPYGADEISSIVADRLAKAIIAFSKNCGMPALRVTLEKYGIHDDKDTFVKKMLPAVKQDSMSSKWRPPIHEDDTRIIEVLESVWNDD
ncbi:MAG: iron-containing alcohol dehydrogenase [Clostridiales Family XIII bacterium]|jgi:alcohol dehydrogenase class IV|nr:iron-containing alcohol dehydrogenase [Clostridiales Family XIII bacterium]